MNAIRRIIDAATTALAGIAAVTVFLLMLHVTVDVLARNFFNRPLPGTTTFVANYYMVIVSALPLAVVERMNAHISVEVVTNMLPSGLRRSIYGLALLVGAVVFFIVTGASFEEAIVQHRLRTFSFEGSYRFVLWYGYFVVPLGYGLGGLYMVLNFVRLLLGADPTESHVSEVEV